jgi:hypothetical protein
MRQTEIEAHPYFKQMQNQGVYLSDRFFVLKSKEEQIMEMIVSKSKIFEQSLI